MKKCSTVNLIEKYPNATKLKAKNKLSEYTIIIMIPFLNKGIIKLRDSAESQIQKLLIRKL